MSKLRKDIQAEVYEEQLRTLQSEMEAIDEEAAESAAGGAGAGTPKDGEIM